MKYMLALEYSVFYILRYSLQILTLYDNRGIEIDAESHGLPVIIVSDT